MSRRKQKFPIHLKNEEGEGEGSGNEGGMECNEPRDTEEEPRVPINGEVAYSPHHQQNQSKHQENTPHRKTTMSPETQQDSPRKKYSPCSQRLQKNASHLRSCQSCKMIQRTSQKSQLEQDEGQKGEHLENFEQKSEGHFENQSEEHLEIILDGHLENNSEGHLQKHSGRELLKKSGGNFENLEKTEKHLENLKNPLGVYLDKKSSQPPKRYGGQGGKFSNLGAKPPPLEFPHFASLPLSVSVVKRDNSAKNDVGKVICEEPQTSAITILKTVNKSANGVTSGEGWGEGRENGDRWRDNSERWREDAEEGEEERGRNGKGWREGREEEERWREQKQEEEMGRETEEKEGWRERREEEERERESRSEGWREGREGWKERRENGERLREKTNRGREKGRGCEDGRSVCPGQQSNNKDTSYTCPVCQDTFKSKRSFNSHIIVHCQLVNGTNGGNNNNKRSLEVSISPAVDRKRPRDNSVPSPPLISTTVEYNNSYMEEDGSGPLDLSCRSGCRSNTPPHPPYVPHPAASSTPDLPHHSVHPHTINHTEQLNHSILSDRGPLEDENENLVNEAREREKAFFNTAQNEQYLTEDSTGLDPPPPLPLYGPGGCVRGVRVCSDEGPPMVYTVRVHAEQVLVTRILGVNDETGDKMELYKCFLCSVAFPSVSRLQAHLSQHKQRFVCCKCSFSCDSRVQFSYHVQREHLTPAVPSRREGSEPVCELSDDSSSAENTVTVAALLSALRQKAQASRSHPAEAEEEEEEEEHCSEDSYPISPSSETQELTENHGGGAGTGNGEESFKMYTCRFCGKKFDRAFSCNRHERVHTGYKPCFCRVCGRGFSEPRNLRHHVIRFHSDGSLRHLIKRDRRTRRNEDDPPTPSLSPGPLRYEAPTRLKDMLKETANKLISSSNIDMTGLSGKTTGLEITLTGKTSGEAKTEDMLVNGDMQLAQSQPPLPSTPPQLDSGKETEPTTAVTTYTTNLTKIIAASLDNSTRGSRRPATDSPRPDDLEPGEIRLDSRTKIVDDGELGRRLVVSDDPVDDPLEHSPHFSNYAPRLNIVQEPIDREKALLPITDDIGRTFFECPYCHKLFGSTSDMNRHLDFHEDLRPYNCEYCDYSARTNSQLKVHKMRHEGIKLYSCDLCNYNGVTQSDLNRHKKTQSHVARSKNICSMCGLGFYTASQKQVHVVQCHPEVEGASSLIQMSLGPPVAPLLTTSNFTHQPTPTVHPPPPPPPHPTAATAQ